MADQFEALRKAVADVCLPIGNMDPDGRTKILDRRYAFQREASVGAIKALLDAHDQLAAAGVETVDALGKCSCCGEGSIRPFATSHRLPEGRVVPLLMWKCDVCKAECAGELETAANAAIVRAARGVDTSRRFTREQVREAARNMPMPPEHLRGLGEPHQISDGVRGTVTAEQARIALDNMDDYARMGGIVPSGAFEVLRAFIEQSAGGVSVLDELRHVAAVTGDPLGKVVRDFNELDAHLKDTAGVNPSRGGEQ